MRNVIEPERYIGQIEIKNIKIDACSRDDIPVILLGLQHIYVTDPLRDVVFNILEDLLPIKAANNGAATVSPDRGRPGMDQWTILVLGTLRLGLNADYDRILELANEHKTLREMLGLSGFNSDKRFFLQTIKDNIKLFTPEILERINVEVVKYGHKLLNIDPEKTIAGRCDTFVVETNVDYPTDINLLYKAICTLLTLCVMLSKKYKIHAFRELKANKKALKRYYIRLVKMKRSTSKDADKRAAKDAEIKKVYIEYMALANEYINFAQQIVLTLKNVHNVADEKLDAFIKHGLRQIDQITRRVINGEIIPHDEKVFSLYEPHTELICKGKAGVPFELGVRVCIVEDYNGFILYSEVCQKTTDDQLAVPIVKSVKNLFPNFNMCSFDKGFSSKENINALKSLLDVVIMPKKGKLSQAEKEMEGAPDFVAARNKHSAVESAINALEVHGLDQCPDHGIDGFKRYVGLAVLSRNIQILGAIIRKRERENILDQKLKKAA